MVKLLIVKKDFKDDFEIVKTKIRTTAGFMRKTRELARKYSTYSPVGKKQLADVYIYDEKKGIHEKLLNHRKLIKQGHESIAKAVKEAQGVNLNVWIP
jgi:hypothetical protein